MQAQNSYSLQISSFVWDHTTLKALIFPADNESWWDPADLNSTLRAMGQWNEAVAGFADNYSEFSYLSSIKFEPEVSSQWQAGYDVYVNYTESPLSDSSDEVGLAQLYADNQNVLTNCTISLATHTAHGVELSGMDMQNIAVHELGHGLGLGHCNYSGDMMYAFYTVGSTAQEISTLDAYGVATLFAWMENPSSFYPVGEWLKENTVTLPDSIAYQGLPMSEQNMPPQSLTDNPLGRFFVSIYEWLLHPEIAVIVIAMIAFLVAVGVFAHYTRPRTRAAITADS
ncbi:MAG: matrixin family metalloprotease [Candidatus Bathyarchaeota archaeon]|nr:matrixin family metalloprotease [Candidatus Bathyarchaeota archaeon]